MGTLPVRQPRAATFSDGVGAARALPHVGAAMQESALQLQSREVAVGVRAGRVVSLKV